MKSGRRFRFLGYVVRTIRILTIGALLVVLGIVLLRTSPLREQSMAQVQPSVASGAVGAVSADLHPYTTVQEKDFGAWKYTATRNDIEGLHATITYDRDSVSGIKAYAAANKALLPQIAKAGGMADVAVTFVYPVSTDWFRTWAKSHGLSVTQAMLRTGAPGTAGGTAGIGGRPDDPLPQKSIDNVLGGFLTHNIYGVFGAYGKADPANLSQLGADPHVFLVDVTPAYVSQDIRQSHLGEPLREVPRVELPFAPMERLGLQNFTQLELPTAIPTPVGTVEPMITQLVP